MEWRAGPKQCVDVFRGLAGGSVGFVFLCDFPHSCICRIGIDLGRHPHDAGRVGPGHQDSLAADDEYGIRLEFAGECPNDALQIFGGTGLSSESELPYLLARTRAWMVAGGSVEMLRNRVAREIFEG